MAGKHRRKRRYAPARRYLFQGLVVAGLLGSVAAWMSADKVVTVEVDGVAHRTRTHAGTVAGVLNGMGLQAGEHDLLAPGKQVAVKDGSRIVFRRGRQLTLAVNGQRRTVWVTASSVGEALNELGLRADANAFLSASRSREIPLSGLSMDLRTPGSVRILDAGRARPVVTTAATVRDLLAQTGIKLAPRDTVSVPLDAYPTAGSTLSITRVSNGTTTTTTPIRPEVQRRPDRTMLVGKSKVVSRGSDGVLLTVFELTFTNDRQTGQRLLRREVVLAPRPTIVAIGTKARPRPKPKPRAAPPGPIPNDVWRRLAACESGLRQNAHGAGGYYHSYFQWSLSTWRRVGMSGDPHNYSYAVQVAAAKRLQARSGWGQWPYCSRRLGLR